MRLRALRTFVSRHMLNIPGWRTDRKLVVLESDDWGSIRMPSRQTYERLVALGYPLANRPFETYDTLASAADFDHLFHTLLTYRDQNGRHPVITANTVMTNPDFGRIRNGGFGVYHYELFTRTLERYGHGNAWNYWQEGMREGLFHPQLHGREHVNVGRWMAALRDGDPDMLTSFEHGMAGIPSPRNPEAGNGLMVAYAYDGPEQRQEQLDGLAEACDLFDQVFGYRSESFIAPVYTWCSDMERVLGEYGVLFIQGGRIQKAACPGGYRRNVHYLGKRNVFGQRYLVRNVYFEPTSNPGRDWVGEAVRYIEAAFRWGKPAIISSHRLNYVGGLCEKNRVEGNRLLSLLLKEILRRWPETEFMTSDELGRLIVESEVE